MDMITVQVSDEQGLDVLWIELWDIVRFHGLNSPCNHAAASIKHIGFTIGDYRNACTGSFSARDRGACAEDNYTGFLLPCRGDGTTAQEDKQEGP